MAAIGLNGQGPLPGTAASRASHHDLRGPVGPMEWIMIAFPPEGLNAGVASALAHLVNAGIIHIIDILVVHRAEDGTAAAAEIEELPPSEFELLDALDGDVLKLLGTDDVPVIADELEPGSSALVVVWEDLWAAALAEEVGVAGGVVVAHDRIVVDDYVAVAIDDEVAHAHGEPS